MAYISLLLFGSMMYDVDMYCSHTLMIFCFMFMNNLTGATFRLWFIVDALYASTDAVGVWILPFYIHLLFIIFII